jgi:hypothetical protein
MALAEEIEGEYPQHPRVAEVIGERGCMAVKHVGGAELRCWLLAGHVVEGLKHLDVPNGVEWAEREVTPADAADLAAPSEPRCARCRRGNDARWRPLFGEHMCEPCVLGWADSITRGGAPIGDALAARSPARPFVPRGPE